MGPLNFWPHERGALKKNYYKFSSKHWLYMLFNGVDPQLKGPLTLFEVWRGKEKFSQYFFCITPPPKYLWMVLYYDALQHLKKWFYVHGQTCRPTQVFQFRGTIFNSACMFFEWTEGVKAGKLCIFETQLCNLGGVSAPLPSGRSQSLPGVGDPEGQNDEENIWVLSLRKNKSNWSKFEEKMRTPNSCPPGTVRVATALPPPPPPGNSTI